MAFVNLDAIISMGCRVNSVQITCFRQWAIRILRENLSLGYNLNVLRMIHG